MRHALFVLGALASGGLATACGHAPTPLEPHWTGSVGMPHRGVLTTPTEVPRSGAGYAFLKDNERHYATPRFAAVIPRAAAKVAAQRPGSMLTIGDISARTGGKVSSHASHRSGRDADLLLYLTTLEGAPIVSTGFVSVGPDGMAWDETNQRFVRLDVEREWLLVKALVEDPEARVQWLFVSKPIEAILLEWARARGESGETLTRAMDAMLQPAPPAQSHDDHIHVRTACDATEVAFGCEPTGPARPWATAADEGLRAPASPEPTIAELAASLMQPLDSHAPALAGH